MLKKYSLHILMEEVREVEYDLHTFVGYTEMNLKVILLVIMPSRAH